MALTFQPLLEVGGHVTDEKTGEQVASIQLERVPRSPLAHGVLKCHGITPDQIVGQTYLFITAAHQHIAAERATYEVQRLAQRFTRAVRIELRPEKGNEPVPAAKSVYCFEGDVGEESDALRLRQKRT